MTSPKAAGGPGEVMAASASTAPTDPVTLMAMWGSMADFDPSHERAFEGPEKRLEVIMRDVDGTHERGLRALPDSTWEGVVASLHAQIVSRIANEEIQSYVLTESSLFVTRNRILLITCGTTTLLNSLPHILDAISAVRGEVEWASFMHKNYSFPWEQRGPHLSMADEYRVLKKNFPRGRPFIFGPVDSDHYFLFAYDDIKRPCLEDDTQMSLTMYGFDRDVARCFFRDEFVGTGPETAEIRRKTGLDTLVGGAAGEDSAGWELHDLQFAPCGYSINAVRGPEYQTMHITPEDHCSFASYETNSRVTNLAERMGRVLRVFRPQRFTAIVMLDPQSPVGRAFAAGEAIGVEPQFHESFVLVSRTINEFGPGYVGVVMNYARAGDPAAAAAVNAEALATTAAAPAASVDS